MAPIRCEATAPGKLILMGEHAAVYGRPALVAAVGLRTRVAVSPVRGRTVELVLSDLDHHESYPWAEVLEYGDRERDRWQSSLEDSTEGHLGSVATSRQSAGFVKVAIAEAMKSLEQSENRQERPGLRISVSSALPVGSGFGSSASVAVAVAAALLGSLSSKKAPGVDVDRVAAIALEAERRQHGRPSGVDHTAVIRGGFLSIVREGDSLRADDLPRPDWLRQAIAVYDTGRPAETTGEVVAAVGKQRDRDPVGFEEILGAMESATSSFQGALGAKDPDWPRLVEAVKSFERCLESLEVVPAPVMRSIRRVEEIGGAAKISGAGSLSGSAAGSMIVVWPPAAGAETDGDAILGDYRRLAAPLGADGLQLGSSGDV